MDELEMIIKALDALEDIQKGLDVYQEGEYPCPRCLIPGSVVGIVAYGRGLWECQNCKIRFMPGFDFTKVMKHTLRERKKNSG